MNSLIKLLHLLYWDRKYEFLVNFFVLHEALIKLFKEKVFHY